MEHPKNPEVEYWKSSDSRMYALADACCNSNSAEELENARNGEPDPVDCKAWGITEGEWITAVTLALNWKLENA